MSHRHRRLFSQHFQTILFVSKVTILKIHTFKSNAFTPREQRASFSFSAGNQWQPDDNLLPTKWNKYQIIPKK